MQWQENVEPLDVRTHHRISDDQNHLLHSLVQLKEKIIYDYEINLVIENKV